MKPLTVVVGLLALMSAGIWVHVIRGRPDAALLQEANRRLDEQCRELAALRIEIDARKSGQLAAGERAAILQAIAEDRVKQQRIADELHRERFLELSLACAGRAKKKYDLSSEQHERLVDVLRLSFDRLQTMELNLRDRMGWSDLDAIVEATNAAYRDFQVWRAEELTKQLGQEIALRVDEDPDLGVLADAQRFELSKHSR